MPVASSVFSFGACGFVAVFVACLGVTLTARAGSGAALAALLALVAAAYVAGILWNTQLLADPTAYLASHPWGGLGPAFTIAMDLGLFAIAGGAALVAAARARHWRWFSGLVVGLAYALSRRRPRPLAAAPGS